MTCSICNKEGHNRRTCSDIELYELRRNNIELNIQITKLEEEKNELNQEIEDRHNINIYCGLLLSTIREEGRQMFYVCQEYKKRYNFILKKLMEEKCKGDELCSICCEEYLKNDNSGIFGCCGQLICLNCKNQHLSIHSNCPFCRGIVL